MSLSPQANRLNQKLSSPSLAASTAPALKANPETSILTASAKLPPPVGGLSAKGSSVAMASSAMENSPGPEKPTNIRENTTRTVQEGVAAGAAALLGLVSFGNPAVSGQMERFNNLSMPTAKKDALREDLKGKSKVANELTAALRNPAMVATLTMPKAIKSDAAVSALTAPQAGRA